MQKKVNPKTAAFHGLWYVSLMKRGTICSATNFPAWKKYKPQRRWLESLYEEKKVTHEQYAELSQHFPVGFANRRRDSLELQREEHARAVRARVSTELEALHKANFFKEPRSFVEIDLFLGHFDNEPRDRRPFLAIIGATQTGKSILGASILRRRALQLGLSQESFLEVTVEDDERLDFSELNVTTHSGVLLDGVTDVRLLKVHREVLQGRPKVTRGGRSATMVYSYPYTLCRVPVIVTLDLSAANLHMFRTNHWLKDDKNVIKLWLREPAFARPGASVRPAETPEEKMRGWSVEETVSFLRGCDLEGPAATCYTSAVAGADLLELTREELINDVKLTPFAAQKIVKARDRFLVSGHVF